MSLIEQDVARRSRHQEFDFSKIDPRVRKTLKPLGKLDNHHGLLALVSDYLVIAFSIYLSVGVSYWFYPVSIVLIGSTQRAFVNLLHESSHKVLAKNLRLNVMLGTIFSGYLVLHLYNPYRNTHIGYHHRFLGDPEKDPDYSFHVECGLYDYKESHATFFVKNILLAVCGFRTFEYLRYVFEDRVLYKAEKAKVSMPIEIGSERILFTVEWLMIISVAAVFGWLHILLLFWVVPMFTTAIAVGWLSELAEHYPLPESENKQLLMTRNRQGWAIENFLLGRHNDNYHLVHHLNTGIPFWNMKRAHKILLNDPAYARWDALWAGILTTPHRMNGRETLISYAAKYRKWRRNGGEPGAASRTFAEVLALAAETAPSRSS